MEEFIAQNLSSYGPVAVFVLLMATGIGVPLGEDLIVIPAGFLVGQQEMGFVPTLVAAYLGVVLSDLMWYGLCFKFGTRLLHLRAFKRMVHPRRLLEAKHQMEARGAWMVVAARFVPGSRTTAITAAGILHMSFWKFAVATASTVWLTALIQIGIGVLSVRVLGVEDTAGLIRLVVGMMVLAISGTLAMKTLRRHRASRRRAPRAKAAWLRRSRMGRDARTGPATTTTAVEQSPDRAG